MKTLDFRNIPTGVLLIAAFYIFGALALLVSIFTNPIGVSQTIAVVHGLPPSMGVEILLVLATLALVLAYGLVRLAPWGFFTMMAYSLYIAGVSLTMDGLHFTLSGQAEIQSFGNLLWSALVVVYLLTVRKRFLKKTPISSS